MKDSRVTTTKEFVITDSNAVQHKAILAGVLEIFNYQEPQQSTSFTTIKGKTVQTVTSWSENRVLKELYVGLSITNPTDAYYIEKGTMIAEGRAMKPNKQIMILTSESRGALGKEMVDVILAQQVEFIQKNFNLFMAVPKKITEECLLF